MDAQWVCHTADSTSCDLSEGDVTLKGREAQKGRVSQNVTCSRTNLNVCLKLKSSDTHAGISDGCSLFLTHRRKSQSQSETEIVCVTVIHRVGRRSRASDHSCFAAEHFSNKETGTGEGEGCSPAPLFLSLFSSMSNTASRDRG